MSTINWHRLPKDATHLHIVADVAYRKYEGAWWAYMGHHGWCKTVETDLWIQSYCASKDEDLEMNGKKVVRGIEDIEIGMFLHNGTYSFFVSDIKGEFISALLLDRDRFLFKQSGLTDFESWSYTFNGGYTPIVKETEAEIKIKELEATIALAQKQLQEYKGMK